MVSHHIYVTCNGYCRETRGAGGQANASDTVKVKPAAAASGGSGGGCC